MVQYAEETDGGVVASGEETVGWSIRQWKQDDGTIQYDWIADRVGGDYSESDELFDSIEEAKADLGV